MPHVHRDRELELLGVDVYPLTMEELNDTIERAVTRCTKTVVANHNLHSIYLYHREPAMRAFFALPQVLPHIDGMPLVLLARLLGHPVRRKQRVTYMDWIDPLMRFAQRRKLRVFYLGGKPEVARTGTELMRDRYRGLEFVAQHGYFDATPGSEENRLRLRQIDDFETNILVVGMGMPRQEIWTGENLPDIEANAILMAGGCLDYLTGNVPTPPRWLGQIGLEWSYRLVSQPRRLARRYLWEPWALLPLLLRNFTGSPKQSPESGDS